MLHSDYSVFKISLIKGIVCLLDQAAGKVLLVYEWEELKERKGI